MPKRLAINIAFNIFIFLSILIFLTPLLNSGDDAFIMYTFSGAFGTTPSALIDYNHGWHFILGFFIAKLFTWFPQINWYTAFLLVVHFASCMLIFHTFFTRMKPAAAVAGYLLYVLFFETFYLLSLSFTNTAVVCSMAGNFFFITALQKNNLNRKKLLVTVLFLSIAGLLRFHAWAFVEVLMAPCILFVKRPALFRYIAYKAALFAVLVLLFFMHVQYYTHYIPDWRDQERVRQVLYSVYNKPPDAVKASRVFKDSVEEQFFSNGFFYDTAFLSENRITEIARPLTRIRDFSRQEDYQMVYWTFMESRIYLFLFVIHLAYLALQRHYGVLKKFALIAMIYALLYACFFVFYKVTGYMFITFFSVSWLVLYLLGMQQQPARIPESGQRIFYAVVCFAACWCGIRIYKTNAVNNSNYKRWLCAYNDVHQHATAVHLAVNNEFPLDYFSVTDVPAAYTLPNFISISQFPKVLYAEKVTQLGLQNVPEACVQKDSIVLIGTKLTALKSYYQEKKHIRVELRDLNARYSCLNAYIIRPAGL